MSAYESKVQVQRTTSGDFVAELPREGGCLDYHHEKASQDGADHSPAAARGSVCSTVDHIIAAAAW